MFDGMQQRDYDPVTFGEPGGNSGFGETLARIGKGGFAMAGPLPIPLDPLIHPQPYAEIFNAGERQTRLADNMWALDRATEDVYDRRIAAVRDATGAVLENPARGGYRPTERELRRLSADGPIDPAAYQRQRFDQALDEIRTAHPDKTEALTFGSIEDDAKALAHGAEVEGQKPYPKEVNPIAAGAASFAGAMWAGRRDQLFVASLFAGPVTAAGKTAMARIVSGGLRQGLYNAGISALEQPSVQAWRQEIGARSGVQPALENVGMAFLFGAIPGAGLTATHELTAARPALERVLRGAAEPGDVEAVSKALGDHLSPLEHSALRMGEDMQAADHATLIPPSKDMTANWPLSMHDDLTAAALKRADDPTAPSPEAVAAVNTIRGYLDSRGLGTRFHGSPSEVGAFEEGFYGSSVNYYGASGFYATDALDVAHGYANRKGAAAPSIYEVRETKPTKIYDMESSISPELRARIEEMSTEKYGSTADLVTSALDENPKNLREFFDEVRAHAASERIPADEVQEGVFHPLMDTLGGLGFDGMSHRGGLRTKTPEHAVTIYFDPRTAIHLRKMSGDELARLRPGVPPPDPALLARIEDARPQNAHEAAVAADEALDDFGRAQGMAVTRAQIGEEQTARQATAAAHVEATAGTKIARDDPLGAVPFIDKKGRPDVLTEREIAKIGERETELGMLVRSCQ